MSLFAKPNKKKLKDPQAQQRDATISEQEKYSVTDNDLQEWMAFKWLLESADQISKEDKYQYIPDYGDVTELNTSRLILDSVGKETLKNITIDAMELLDTSLAIYEKNGDYAFGIFESGWCQLMDAASRKLCGDVDNKTALSSGKWLCHENCWNDSAKAAMVSKLATDIECVGGIHLYAEPIFADGQVIGAINIGYGNPSDDEKVLAELAQKFNLDINILQNKAADYKKRPPYFFKLAKMRLHSIAILIGNIVERNIARNKLQKSEESFRLLAEVTFEGVILHKEGIIQDVNESFCKMSGYTKEECLGANLLEYVNIGDSIDKVKEKIIKNYAEPYVIQAQRKDGSLFFAELEARSIDQYGEKLRIVAVHDITTRYEADQKLKESNERFSALINQAPDMLFVHDKNGRIIEVNISAEKKYGYTRNELLNMSMTDIVPDYHLKVEKEDFWNNVKEGSAHTFISQHKCKNGHIFPVEISLGRIKINDQIHYLGLARDITERIEAEKTIHNNEEMFRLLAENSVDCIWQMTTKLKFTYISPSLFLLVGFKPEEWIGTNFWEHTSRKEFIKVARLTLTSIKKFKTSKYNIFEVKLFNKNRELVPVEIIGRLLVRDGKLIGLQGSARLIIERKKQEEELNNYRNNLELLVKDRTQELEEKNAELIRYNKLFVGREFRIKELRDKVKELEERLHITHPD